MLFCNALLKFMKVFIILYNFHFNPDILCIFKYYLLIFSHFNSDITYVSKYLFLFLDNVLLFGVDLNSELFYIF